MIFFGLTVTNIELSPEVKKKKKIYNFEKKKNIKEFVDTYQWSLILTLNFEKKILWGFGLRVLWKLSGYMKLMWVV